ncbi:MAG: erythromycin esterase family protein [Bacteroidota bacterium]
MKKQVFSGTLFLLTMFGFSQDSKLVNSINIESNDNFSGFETIEIADQQLFVLAEHWHNIKSVPKATLKLLRYLHKHANVRVLAIEHGKSTAFMINEYLLTGDELMLQHITRNTMFWAKENRKFFKDLRAFNLTLPEKDRVIVKSIDIEYKMEAAIFMINQFIGSKTIPDSLKTIIGEFRRIYEETKIHRESYEGLAIMYYYDREWIQQLIIETINDLEDNSEQYIDFFDEDFTQFATMILEMDDGLTFDYTNPNQNYRFRDRLIYKNFTELLESYPSVGILCPIGMRHVMKKSSIHNLEHRESSPVKGRVMNIRISALYKNFINASDLKKINYNYPKQLKVNDATLIKHIPENKILRSNKGFDYTIFINENGVLTPFEKVLNERY